MALPGKVASRLAEGLKKFKPILEAAQKKDVNESDTVIIVQDILHEVFGFDKYSEITSEHSSTVLGELYYGAARSGQPRQNLERLEEFAATCTVLATDGHTARVYGSIKDELRQRGRPIPDNDLWIAASARQHSLVLVTRDHHFSQVTGLQTAAW